MIDNYGDWRLFGTITITLLFDTECSTKLVTVLKKLDVGGKLDFSLTSAQDISHIEVSILLSYGT